MSGGRPAGRWLGLAAEARASTRETGRAQQRPAAAHVHGPREDEQDVEEGSRGDGRGRDEVDDGRDGG